MASSTNTREQLLSAAQTFCDSFANKDAPDTILGHFSASDSVLALEHGLPQLAPFLGRPFRGQKGLQEYFQLLSSSLTYENMRFSNYVVDAAVSKVSVRGEAKFTWTSTNQSWDEVFTYVLEFDAENRVKVYEIWAGTFQRSPTVEIDEFWVMTTLQIVVLPTWRARVSFINKILPQNHSYQSRS
jgi:hypothetical protein